MIKLGVLGASGRMGQRTLALLENDYKQDFILGPIPKSNWELSTLFENDVIVDFSLAEGTFALVKALQDARLKSTTSKLPRLVSGTTGLKPEQLAEFENLGKFTAVIRADNFSTGILVLSQALKKAAKDLSKAGYTAVLTDTHHQHKKDSPSGTAKFLSSLIPGKVEVTSHRVGEVTGEHEVTFYGPSDRVSFAHQSHDRDLYARGALDVALWLAKLPNERAGVFTLEDYYQDRFGSPS